MRCQDKVCRCGVDFDEDRGDERIQGVQRDLYVCINSAANDNVAICQ